jgi:hypothetical protein
MRLAVFGLLTSACLAASPPALAQGVSDYELAPILYSQTPPSNRVEQLKHRLARGEVALRAGTEADTVRRCLDAVGVSPHSQVLVFSKTSLQRNRIRPDHPRALFFSDDCYVGWVPGGLLEIAVTDPRLGLVFYRVNPASGVDEPPVVRDEECLTCHAGPLTRQWPALIVRSVFPDANGEPIARLGAFLTDHTSPFSERWGGWYVTGQHGHARHLGNLTVASPAPDTPLDLDRERGANLSRLDGLFPTERYMRGDSDIVALVILEHQVTLHNRLAEGGLRVRRWMHYQQALQRELGDPVSTDPTGTARRVVESETRRILEALLFVDEAPLPEGGIRGHPDFQAAFLHNRRPDPRNRSLKDLNLRTRIQEYRCSYLIHSEAFAYLPAELRASVYRSLRRILTTENPGRPFDHLTAPEKAAIVEILDATQPEWRRG